MASGIKPEDISEDDAQTAFNALATDHIIGQWWSRVFYAEEDGVPDGFTEHQFIIEAQGDKLDSEDNQVPNFIGPDLTDEKWMEAYDEAIENLRGEVVFPTSKTQTTAYRIFSVYKTGAERDVGWGVLNNHPRLDGVSISALLGFSSPSREIKVGNEEVNIFRGLSDGENLTYFSPKVWSGQDPPVFRFDKNLKKRFESMADLQPASKGKGGQDFSRSMVSTRGGISPITQFYLMRHLGVYLNMDFEKEGKPSLASQAIPYKGRAGTVLRSIDITRKNTIDLEETFRDIIEGKLGRTAIDSRFPFERVRTIYRYPRNYDKNEIVSGLSLAKEPSPFDADVRESLEYGLLQKLYTVLKKKDREAFLEAVKSQIYDEIEKEDFVLPGRPKLGDGSRSPIEKRYGNSIAMPILNGSYKVAEAMLSFAEMDPTDSTEEVLKLRLDAADPESRQLISDGASIVVPGWLVLAAEMKGRHKWVSTVMGVRNYNYTAELGRETRGLMKNSEGVRHVADVILFFRNQPGENNLEEQLVSLLDESHEFLVATRGDTVQATMIAEESAHTFFLNKKTLENGIIESDFKLKPAGSPTPEGTLKSGDNIVPAYIATAKDSGLTQDNLTPSDARAFNSLGYIVEEMMVNSAMISTITAKGVTQFSDFDKIMIGLIGTNRYPGIATSQAILHYQYLFALTTNPVKNWQAVDSNLFQQGSLLALESFFSEPAKKTLYFLLNSKGFIDVGDFEGGSPKFFRAPMSARVSDARFTGLLNSFALIVVSYYRLLFSQIRNRMVVERRTKAKGKVTEETIDLKALWREMVRDAEANTPSPKIFGLMLRWFSNAENNIIEVPSWMPVMPKAMVGEDKMNKNDVINYLKWAYSTNSVDPEYFAEISAAYHASKVLSFLDEKSYLKSYAAMLENFIESVDQDMGHGFLFAILANERCPLPTSETPEVSDIIQMQVVTEDRPGGEAPEVGRPRSVAEAVREIVFSEVQEPIAKDKEESPQELQQIFDGLLSLVQYAENGNEAEVRAVASSLEGVMSGLNFAKGFAGRNAKSMLEALFKLAQSDNPNLDNVVGDSQRASSALTARGVLDG